MKIIKKTTFLLIAWVLLTGCGLFSRSKHVLGSTSGALTAPHAPAPGGGLGDTPDDPNPGARDGTLGLLNFSNAARFYRAALTLSKYPGQTAFSTNLLTAQGALPITNRAVEAQAPAQIMALQQLAVSACRDMLAGENALPAGSRTFLSGLDVTRGPAAVPPDSLRTYFARISVAFTGAQPSPATVDALNAGYQAAATAAPGVPPLSASPTQQTLAALQIACAAMGSSARAVKQ